MRHVTSNGDAKYEDRVTGFFIKGFIVEGRFNNMSHKWKYHSQVPKG